MKTKLFVLLAVILTIPCLAKITVREYALPAVEGIPFRPIVQGDWALALLNTDPKNISTTIGVLAYDLKAKKVYALHKGKADFPAITGSIVMWSGKVDDVPSLSGTAGKRGIFPSCLILHHLSSGRYWAPLLKTNSANFIAASGKYLTYELGSKIYLYDIATNAQKQISDDRSLHTCPDIGGDLVSWREYDSAHKNSRTRGYRISTGEELLFEESFQQPIGAPRTDGEYVAWWDNARGSSIFDTKTGKVRVIKAAFYPDVGNGFAVYSKDTGTGMPAGKGLQRTVYGMDLTTGEEFQISQVIPDSQIQFRIEGNRVVWIEGSVLHCADLTRTSELKLFDK